MRQSFSEKQHKHNHHHLLGFLRIGHKDGVFIQKRLEYFV